MKKEFYLILFSVLLYHFSNAQPPIQWQKCYGGSGINQPYSICQTTDSGYIIAGYSSSNDGDITGSHGNVDCWIVKIDKNGDLQWQKALGGSMYDYAYSVQQTKDGGYIFAGATDSNDSDVTMNRGYDDYWVVKLDASGNLKWQKTFGGSGEDVAEVVEQTTDGGYIVGGNSDSNDSDVTGNHGGSDYWIVKLDTGGAIQWQKSLGGSGDDELADMHQTSDKGYILTGYTQSDDGDVESGHGTLGGSWTIKLDSSGGIQWQVLYFCADTTQSNCNGSHASSVIQTKDGGYIVGGTLDILNDQHFFEAVKLDSSGKILGHDYFGNYPVNINYNLCYSIKNTSDNGYIMAGSSAPDGSTDYFYVSKKGDSGSWSFVFGNPNGDDIAASAIETSDGGFIIVGYAVGDLTCSDHYVNYKIIKLSGIPTSVQELMSDKKFNLYPNPATNQLTIHSSSFKDKVTVSIFNVLGGKMLAFSLSFGEGRGEAIDISKFSSGLYFIEVVGEKERWVGKFVKE